MNQNTRTLTFVAVALVAVAGAWWTRPSAARIPADDVVNKPLAPEFADPLAARSMEIIDFDEATGEPKIFKVAQVNGIWSLPSKYGYPADAERQLGEAAANLMDLRMLGVASNSAADHALFGVLDPSTAKVGATGVGKKITLEGEGGKPLLRVIVGKEVKDAPDQRYVRIPGHDAVYPVKINTSKLSTKFEDWIEKDLLKLSGWDIVEVIQNNYSVDRVRGSVTPGEVVELKYDDMQSKWTMEGLEEGEELDTAKLNEMKNALDDLKIVDVRRKPPGLSAELRSEEGIQLDQQALMSLAQRGFYLTQDGSLLSNEGEVIVHTKDGIEYVLRFGDIATGTEEGDDDAQANDEADGQEGVDPKPKSGANRYIFVTARFDESLIAKPEGLDDAPGEATDEAPSDATPADEEEAASPPSDEPAADDQPDPQGAGGDDAGQPAGDEPAEPSDEAPAAQDQGAAADDAAESAAQGPAPAVDEAQQQALAAERLRKQSEYEDKIKRGRERVKELNDRFADWYYVISNDVYNKIHLSRADVLKKPEGEAGDAPKSPLDELQEFEQGLPAAP